MVSCEDLSVGVRPGRGAGNLMLSRGTPAHTQDVNNKHYTIRDNPPQKHTMENAYIILKNERKNMIISLAKI